MAHQTERFTSFIKKEIAAFLEARVPRPEEALVSVTRVLVSDSFDRAEIFVSVFPEKYQSEVMRELPRFEKEARAFIAGRLKRHKIPAIRFLFDTEFAPALRLEKLLENIEDKG